MSNFQGFEEPKQNWSKLPHQFINELDKVETLGELKVVIYVLRHTWGYHESQKRITMDELQSGRKKADGSRIDNGTGMSKTSIRLGIEKAVEHGFLTVYVDDSDAARIKKYYSLNSGGSEVNPQDNLGGQNLYPGEQKLYPGGSESVPRTEKETIRKKPKKNSSKPAPEIEAPPEKNNNDYDDGSDLGFDKIDTEVKDVCTLYLGTIGPMNQIISDDIKAVMDEISPPENETRFQWFEYAIKQAATNDRTCWNWNYVKAIILGGKRPGIAQSGSLAKHVSEFEQGRKSQNGSGQPTSAVNREAQRAADERRRMLDQGYQIVPAA